MTLILILGQKGLTALFRLLCLSAAGVAVKVTTAKKVEALGAEDHGRSLSQESVLPVKVIAAARARRKLAEMEVAQALQELLE